MDIKITLDLSERAHAALVGIAEAFRDMVVRGGYLHDECEYRKMRETLSEKCAEDAQEHAQIAQIVEPVVEPQTDDEPEQPAEQEAPADVTVAAPEPAPKRGRGRPPKKRENLAPVDAISAPVDNRAPEPEKSSQDETSCDAAADTHAPVEPEKVPGEPAVPAAAPTTAEDPYHGMTLMQAVSALMAEVHDTGVELADANARVRKECEARGLPYNSAACLMKDMGYDATRKIALGL